MNQKTKPSISLESRLMNLIGSAVYGPPAKHGLPADFFYRIEDRRLHNMQTNVLCNLTRARLVKAERWIAKGLGLALVGVWAVYMLPKFLFL